MRGHARLVVTTSLALSALLIFSDFINMLESVIILIVRRRLRRMCFVFCLQTMTCSGRCFSFCNFSCNFQCFGRITFCWFLVLCETMSRRTSRTWVLVSASLASLAARWSDWMVSCIALSLWKEVVSSSPRTRQHGHVGSTLQIYVYTKSSIRILPSARGNPDDSANSWHGHLLHKFCL